MSAEYASPPTNHHGGLIEPGYGFDAILPLSDTDFQYTAGTPPFASQAIATDMTSPFAGLSPSEINRELMYMRIAESMALNDIIAPPSERALYPIYQTDRPTMAHELGHALIAHDQGYHGDFTARPAGDARGLTRLYGNPSDEHFSIMAAGSMFSDHFGAPDGYGHDHYQIHMRNIYGDGLPLQSAQSEAINHLKKYNNIYHELTDIATYLQHSLNLDAIPFSQIPLLLERANQEVRLREAGIEQEVYKYLHAANPQTVARMREELHAALLRPLTYRDIIDYGNGMHGVIQFVNGKIVEHYTYCFCGGRNGSHTADCPILNRTIGNNTDNADYPPLQTVKINDVRGVIFERTAD